MIEKTQYNSIDSPTREARINYLKKNCKRYAGFELQNTSKGEEVFVAYRFGIQIEIDVYRINTHLYDGYAMTLFATRHEKNKVFIHDITGRKLKGYGSIIIERLLDYARKEHIKEISGEFSSLDLANHKELLLRFYSKFGAICSINESNTGGVVELRLQ